jgi:N-acetylneuraminic acid mutarotase
LNQFMSSLSRMRSILVQGISALVLFAVVGSVPIAHAQTSAWGWVNGSSVFTDNSSGEVGQPGVYGTLGQPASTNVPGGRLGAVSWTDKDGNFWLFGGGGLDSAENFGLLNDLWEFTPSTGEWTWISGGDTIPGFNGGNPGVYGQKGVAAAANTPGSRTGAFGWTDSNGNLWLFGGGGFDANASDGSGVNLNDLWKFNVTTKQWAWMGGSSSLGVNGSAAGIYGAQGSFTAGSYPGSREFGSSWTDNKGNLWLFGGLGEGAASSNIAGDLNDLWEFIPSTGQWAWIGGGSNTPQTSVYSALGTFAAGNSPSARDSATAWTDKNGNLWLFGGISSAQGGNAGPSNDLWEFNPSTDEWAWMGGSPILPTDCSHPTGAYCAWPGVYGTQGTASAANMPGSRESATAWTAQDGSLWLFGGIGADSATVLGLLNDLWKFDPSTNEWTWVAGNNTANMAGVYGTQGTPAPANVPGGRDSAVSWIDTNGNLWLFGGNGLDAHGAVNANGVLIVGYLNDLWEYQPIVATPTFTPAAGTYSSAQNITLSDTTSGATIYYTTDGTTPTTSSTEYTGAITVSSTETIEAIAVATGYANSTVASATYTINLPPPPIAATPTFTPTAGTYTSVQNVTLADTTPGATIYYTIDGTTPSTSSAKYAGAIAVSTTETIEAIAVATGYANSTVASATYTINLPPPSFTLAASPTSLTVNSGSQGVITLNIASQNGFDSPVSFACSGLPSGASCSFSPASITPSNAGTASTQLTLATSTQSSALGSDSRPFLPGIPLTLAVGFFWIKRRRRLWSVLLLAVVFIGVGAITACGGGGSNSSSGSSSSSAPVTSTITLKATSGTIQQSTTISLTVN